MIKLQDMLDNKKIWFVSGVSGVGKTSVIPYLKSLLPLGYEIHDFDEGGVPAGADYKWRIDRTKEWIRFGDCKLADDITIIVCGIANPEEIEVIKKDFPNLDIVVILLDGEVEVIEQRFRDRNKDKKVENNLKRVVGSVDKFIKDNSNFLLALREISKKHNCQIIDTTHISPEDVAKKIVDLINNHKKDYPNAKDICDNWRTGGWKDDCN